MSQQINSLVEELETKDTNERRATKGKMKSDSRENSRSRKRMKPNSCSQTDKPRQPRQPLELETDANILHRRQKQIDYGKNTVGYHNYMQEVPFDQRTSEHPKTPEKYYKYSRRSWDAMIKSWRKELHTFDTEPNLGQNLDSDEETDEDSKNVSSWVV